MEVICTICHSVCDHYGGYWVGYKGPWKGFGFVLFGNVQWSGTDSIQERMWQHTYKLIIDEKQFDGNILY